MSDERARNWRQATKLVRGGTLRSGFQETSEALFMTSGFVYDRAEDAEAAFRNEIERFTYSRFANPTVAMFEERMALLEGARFCRATASGMAAVSASLLATVSAGDRVVGSRALFGACLYILTDLLPRFGVETELVDGTDLEQWRRALARPAKAVLLETPSNPCLEIIDLAAVADLAHAAGARLVVDNVFATPILQRPLEFGADIVAYSTTKYIDGQGRGLGGAVLTSDEAWLKDTFTPFFRNTGPAMSPFNAWMLLKGLETLDLRFRRHCANALEVARFLEGHPRVRRVFHPGLASHPRHELALRQMDGSGGAIVAFEVEGGKDGAFATLNGLGLIDISNNLGDAKSLITHPATTTHQRLSEAERAAAGITPGLIRLSVGLEDPRDLIEDLDRALSR